MRALLRTDAVSNIKVLSPIPSFPTSSLSLWPYRGFAKVPARARRNGIEILYPRYLNIPGLGMHLQPALMAKSLIPAIERLIAEGYDFDLIDAYFFYPDGVAAAHVAEKFGKPLVITAFGSDLSAIAANSPRAARRIRWAAERATACTTVCQALKDSLVSLGIDGQKIDVIRHGVDLELFRPATNRTALREKLGFRRPTLFTAGHLIEPKGIYIAIEAMRDLKEFDLVIAGTGPEEASLRRLAAALDDPSRVRFLGHVDQSDLGDYFAAADAFVLMSSREGIPNVIMESMACGTPVVATGVGGIPEVMTAPEAGVVIAERSSAALVKGVRALMASSPDRAATRRHAEPFTWERTSSAQLAVYERCLGK